MIKKLCLLIAKLALRPPSITLDDLTYVSGIDFKGSLAKMQKEFLLMKTKVDALGVDLTPDTLVKIITATNKITERQKLALTSILQSPELRDVSYLG